MNVRQIVLMERLRTAQQELAQFEADAALVRSVTGRVEYDAREAIRRGAEFVESLRIQLAAESTCF